MIRGVNTAPCPTTINALARANKRPLGTRKTTPVTRVDVVAKVFACHGTRRPNSNIVIAHDTNNFVLRDVESCV